MLYIIFFFMFILSLIYVTGIYKYNYQFVTNSNLRKKNNEEENKLVILSVGKILQYI